jgi:hypothetical protein
VVGLGLTLVAGACGGSDSPDLDLAKAERVIRRLSTTAYADEADVGGVKCPERVDQKEGLVFACTVAIDGEPLTYRVVQKDERGNVRIEQIEAVTFTSKVEAFVESYARENGRPAREVSCGEAKLSTRAPGQRFSCTVEFEDGASGTARLIVRDTTGTVGLQSLTGVGSTGGLPDVG